GVQGRFEAKAEPVEVLPDGVKFGIASIQLSSSDALRLDHQPHPGGYSGGDDLNTFGVEVAAKSLEVGAEQHDVAAQVLVGEIRRGNRRERRGALRFDVVQPRYPAILPALQGGGRHQVPPVCV